ARKRRFHTAGVARSDFGGDSGVQVSVRNVALPRAIGKLQVDVKRNETMTHRRFWVYFLLFLFNVICYLDRINMSVAGRPVAQDFGLSPIQLGYLFSSFLLAYVVLMLP